MLRLKTPQYAKKTTAKKTGKTRELNSILSLFQNRPIGRPGTIVSTRFAIWRSPSYLNITTEYKARTPR